MKSLLGGIQAFVYIKYGILIEIQPNTETEAKDNDR